MTGRRYCYILTLKSKRFLTEMTLSYSGLHSSKTLPTLSEGSTNEKTKRNPTGTWRCNRKVKQLYSAANRYSFIIGFAEVLSKLLQNFVPWSKFHLYKRRWSLIYKISAIERLRYCSWRGVPLLCLIPLYIFRNLPVHPLRAGQAAILVLKLRKLSVYNHGTVMRLKLGLDLRNRTF